MDRILKVLTIFFFSVVLVSNFMAKGEYFTLLSEAFLSGKTYYLRQPDPIWLDTTFFEGKYYSPHGPLTPIVLMPFVFLFSHFGMIFYQGFLQPFLVFGVFVLMYKIAKTLGYTKEDSLFLAYGFCFSTVFLGSALWPHFIPQTLTTLLLSLLIYGYFKNIGPLFMGGLTGLLFLTRASTLGSIIFPTTNILTLSKIKASIRFKRLFLAIIPLVLSLLFCSFYNWMRFGNVFESGYSSAVNLPASLASRNYGVFSLVHVPGNLYYFLLATPQPVFRDGVSHVLKFPFLKANIWGMSIFITSPIFFYLFFLNYKDRLSKILIVTIIFISVPIFLFYGIGFRQFGYRYALDFLPFLYFLLIKNYMDKFGALSRGFKLLILFSSLMNFYLFLSVFVY